ncbi:MAG: tyrosine-protein phosphatase [Hamadaea sp.]|nr:tyrosine-protein phosphatase [Hamadaea sp.]
MYDTHVALRGGRVTAANATRYVDRLLGAGLGPAETVRRRPAVGHDGTVTVSFALPSVVNLRDLGGTPVGAGTMRFGRLLRSGQLDRLTDGEQAALAAFGVTSVFDLRTTAERDRRPDRLPIGVALIVADVLAGDPDTGATGLAALAANPRGMTALSDGGAVTLMLGSYRDMVRLPSADAAYRSLFSGVAAGRPLLFHCTAGKDRTGWAAAVLLMLLGADEQTVVEDYLRSNDAVLLASRPLLDRIEQAGVDPAAVLPLLEVRAEYLQAALEEMRARHGDVQTYAERVLGLDAAAVDRLRAALID